MRTSLEKAILYYVQKTKRNKKSKNWQINQEHFRENTHTVIMNDFFH